MSDSRAAVQAPGKSLRFRFSLRTLLIASLLIGSAATLWWRWEPWILIDSHRCVMPIDSEEKGKPGQVVCIVDDDLNIISNPTWTMDLKSERVSIKSAGVDSSRTWMELKSGAVHQLDDHHSLTVESTDQELSLAFSRLCCGELLDRIRIAFISGAQCTPRLPSHS